MQTIASVIYVHETRKLMNFHYSFIQLQELNNILDYLFHNLLLSNVQYESIFSYYIYHICKHNIFCSSVDGAWVFLQDRVFLRGSETNRHNDRLRKYKILSLSIRSIELLIYIQEGSSWTSIPPSSKFNILISLASIP